MVETSLQIIPRGALPPSRWNDYVEAHPGGWWFHRSEWLDYSMAYMGTADESVAWMEGDQLVGICPAICEGDQPGHISMGGDPCIGPLIDTSLNPDKAVAALQTNGLLCRPLSWRWSFPSEGGAIADALCRSLGVEMGGWMTSMQELQQPVAALWQTLRKSYRTTIKSAQRGCELLIGGIELWDHYETCHKDSAARGGFARSQATYDCQHQMVSNGHGVLVVAKDRASGGCASATLAFVYKSHAYSASGPSSIRGTQHACQWAMINELRDRGIKTYELGWDMQPGGNTKIEFFKRGFGEGWFGVQVVTTEAGNCHRSGPIRKPSTAT